MEEMVVQPLEESWSLRSEQLTWHPIPMVEMPMAVMVDVVATADPGKATVEAVLPGAVE